MGEMLITYRGIVQPWQCDQMNHLNIMWYVGKFDEATWQLFAMIGITAQYLRQRQCGVAAVRQSNSYRRELFAGDVISIRTGVLSIDARKIRFYHEMLQDDTGKLAATSLISGVHLDLTSRQPCPFPEDILERGRRMIVDIHPVT